ncbi:MAG TPA: hypothetical protein VLC52_14875 [Anaerolineae bacterium]|nr:hypothetical protein [Anaerolineae bacterium]
MSRLWKMVGIATLVAILGVAGVSAVALAQDDGTGEPFDFQTRFREALAGILGISVEEYDAAVEEAQGQVVDEAVAEGWLTEEQAEMMRWRLEQAPGAGIGGFGKGFHMGGPGIGHLGNNLLSVAAEQLNMTLTELMDALQDGSSIADLAEEAGVDTQTIVDAYLAEVREDVDEAVSEGRMTQTQADYYLEQLQTRITGQLDNTWENGLHIEGGLRRGGGGMDFPGLGGF